MPTNPWSDTGWFLETTGSRDLFSTVGAIGGYSARASIAWRGLSSSDYSLSSSLQRGGEDLEEDEIRDKERRTIEAAREWGLGFGAAGWSSDLQLLADLQHYGTRTRLIDVTSNPMTALWFACQPPIQPEEGPLVSEDGLLLAINTAGWKRYGRSMPSGSYSAMQNPFSWELEAALAEEEAFVVESLVPNDRLRAQEGFFIAGRIPSIHERQGPFPGFRMSFDSMSATELKARLRRRRDGGETDRDQLPFIAVRIPSQRKERILRRLENSYNRRAQVLFPDFAGFRDFSVHAEVREPTTDLKSAR